MKTNIKNSFLLPALLEGLNLLPAGPVTAQTFTTLHSFTDFPAIPADGANPNDLVLSGNTLYGYSATSEGEVAEKATGLERVGS